MLKNILKQTLIFGAVGIALSLIAPVIGLAFGVVGGATTYAGAAAVLGHAAMPMWLGPFFGMFGALDAIIGPIIKPFFGDKSSETPAANIASEKKEAAKQVNITVVQSPQQSQGQAVVSTKHRDYIKTERTSIEPDTTLSA